MYDARSTETAQRPANCPFCKSKIIDTLAKVITPTSFWRCRDCEKTWTIATMPSAPRSR